MRWLTLLPALLTQGCYYLQQGTALLGIYSRAREITDLLQDPQLTPEVRSFLELALRIRRFGVELGLRDTPNYSAYVELDRQYLASVVSASRPLAFEPHLWWHPFVGSVPYQGYFDPGQALAEKERLEKEGWDVWVRPVRAFSTLGWLRDPLFSFMIHFSPGQLAELLLHEQTHATVWIPGQVAFNEALAVVVGRLGARQFLQAAFGPDSPEALAYEEYLRTNQEFLDLFLGLKRSLEELYREDLAPQAMLAEKERRIEAFRQALPESLAAWRRAVINNAVLLTLGTYEDRTAEVEAFVNDLGGVRPALEKLRDLPRNHPDPWGWMEGIRKQSAP